MSKLFMEVDFPSGIIKNVQLREVPNYVAERFLRNVFPSTTDYRRHYLYHE